MNKVYLADNLKVLHETPSDSVDLIYIDPPFNTGKKQQRKQEDGLILSYHDKFDDLESFLLPRMVEARRVLKSTGSFYFHIDYREVHYCKLLLDYVFGRASFINEIIWAYDYGARTKSRWPAKHDNILFYAKDPERFTFNYAEIDRIPYMSPGLVGPEKAEKGKTVTDVWWNTIVPTNGKEKTGYPTQKPIAILRRIVKVSSNPGDLVMDFFAGSGTTGAACQELGRQFVLVDANPEAFSTIRKRLGENSISYEEL